MRIYKRSDRIAVKIDGVTVKLAPLSLDQKSEIQQAMIEGRLKTNIKEATRGIALSIKYAVKGIEGVEDSDGKAYQLQFEGEVLTDECVEDLMNMELSKKLSMVCASLTNGVRTQFTDEQDKALQGVEVIKAGKDEAGNG